MQVHFYQPKVNLAVIGITAFISLLSLINFDLMQTLQYGLLVLGTLFIGIPHGATDDHIFYAAGLERWLPGQGKAFFYASYLLVAAFYTVIWLTWPLGAFGLFLLLSIYHFGQSHLFFYTSSLPTLAERLFYGTWGAYVLFSPILFQYGEALPIIRTLIGFVPVSQAMVSVWSMVLVVTMFIINGAGFTSWALRQKISMQRWLLELCNLLILGVLAYSTPLFIAFITYWALWHSLNSVFEIRRFLSLKRGEVDFRNFAKKAFPLTLVTLAGLLCLFWLTESWGNRDQLLAVFFIVIATVTLPHSLIMERLYQEAGKTG